ncbi:IS66 family transposase [Chitinophaga sancti]|uniref:IS66 family transposase n=3 Tax=Chitinophaga sancti TaxID=1004 RepID=A0ABZ0XRG2_9BACT|nr:IS66 family transposase [Chitinophaga sancti]WQD60028.1 IS66 family transposase [Chitinophaga sancti]WQD61437.1 IS66 family transposase [Chitinophaga sancti]WQG87842.1 IS66 family transposase [Chitinophaga sancti]WQG92664.1 IS66 family transposase [Chitinophaga sancti]WQG93010.1 IS66 family transposase [Chitinophaga sancti]
MKPEIIYTLPEALEQVNALQLQKADLSNSLTQERHVFSRIIQELTTENTALKEEKDQLRRWLSNEQERGIDKDRRITSLEETIAEMQTALASKTDEAQRKDWQLKELQEMLFGQRSEKFIPDAATTQTAIQQTLGEEFDKTEVEAIIEQTIASTITDTQTGTTSKTSRRKKRHKAHKGRRPIPTHLETETIVYDIAGDKTGMKPMGKKVSVYYEIIPGKLIRKEEHHLQYKSADGKIHCTPVQPRMIERGIVSNRLLAHLHSERFVYYMPYYRQQQRFERLTGVSFAASTIDHWEEVCYKKLKRLLKLLKKTIQTANYLKADETRLRYLHDEGQGKAANGWMWVFHAPEHKLVLFEFHPGRANDVPKEILKDFAGILQTDALSSYTAAFKENNKVTLMSCLAHIRRGFKKSQRQNKVLSDQVLVYFNIIYRIEAYAKRKHFTPDQRLALRQKYSKPFFDKIRSWLDEHKDKHVPDSLLAKAITYANNQWDKLNILFLNGRIDVDNNTTENAIRPITLFRKNSLFASNEHGGERAALFYSLVETCKLNGIDPFEYLNDVYNRLHDCSAAELIHLLPPNWKPTEARKTAM